MRKDVKLVVGAACVLLIGLLSYVLLAPNHKKGAVAEEGTDGSPLPVATDNTANTTQQGAPVAVTLNPTTQPSNAVTVVLSPTTQPSVAVLPGVDSNVPVGSPPVTATDWATTLNTGSVATASGVRSGGALPASTLIGVTDSTPSMAPAAGPATRPSVAMTSSKTHKVVYGETLSSIAAEFYGNRASYTKIMAANPSIDPNRLKVGTVLQIPDLKADASDSATTASDKTSPTSGNTYTVKPGDSLQRIASKLYGSSDKWQKIYELNRSSIGGDPHRLRAGAVLKLPETPSVSTAIAH